MQTMYDGVNGSPSNKLLNLINSSATSITLDSSSNLPTAPNIATIGDSATAEVILYTGKSGSTLTGVTRGFGGTTAQSWAANTPVYRAFTKYDYDAIKTNINTMGDATSTNLLINGNFNVNQRAKSGTVTLAAGVYGHDRWKAGASGCTYTFATSANVTTLTISAGSLVQVIEGANLKSGTVCLSWTGTAQGKIGAGSFGASGITGTATGGTNLNIEFNAGTLSNVQLNYGSVALPFVPRSYADDLRLSERYYRKIVVNTLATIYATGYARMSGASFTTMRTSPTASVNSVSFSGNDGTEGSLYATGVSNGNISLVYSWTGGTVGKAFTISTSIDLDAEL